MKRTTRANAIDAKRALLIANEFILFHYPTLFTGAHPRRLRFVSREFWVVPIVLTHPYSGPLGHAGFVAVDGVRGKVVGSTPRNEVVAAGRRLREGKPHALEADVLSPGAR